jgi:hypothetical protein
MDEMHICLEGEGKIGRIPGGVERAWGKVYGSDDGLHDGCVLAKLREIPFLFYDKGPMQI